MAARIVRVLLQLCTISVITGLISAQISGIQFLVEPTDVIAASGRTAEFHCVVDESREPVSIVWFHNDTEIRDNKNRFVDSNGSLVFHKVRRNRKSKNGLESDSGEYKCLAKARTIALLSRTATLRMADLSPFSKHPENVTVHEGETVRLFCQAKSLPAAEITWTFQNQSINYEELKRFDASIPGVLYIRNARTSDAGEYRCIATNYVLSKREISTVGSLTVERGKPEPSNSTTTFLSPQFPPVVTVYENEPLTLECGVGGLSNVKIAWTYKKSPDSPESLIEETPYPYSVFRKSNITVDDGGTYTCVVSRAGSILNVNRSVTVDVMTPPVVEVEPKSEMLPVARSTRFTCKVRGRPQPAISWLHNGKALTTLDFRFRLRRLENELIIRSPMAADAGIYQCVANNVLGMASAHAYLYINDSLKPSTPINVQCNALNSSAVQVWWDIVDERETGTKPRIIIKQQEPDEENDQSMLKDDDTSAAVALPPPPQETPSRAYTVNYSPSDGGKELVMPTTSKVIDIGNLNAEESYTFYVRTFNGASGSDPSEKIVCETLDADSDSETPSQERGPPPPLMSGNTPRRAGPPITASSNDPFLETTRINETTIRVSWDFEKPNIANDEYKVVCKNASGYPIKLINVDFNDKEATFTDLKPNSAYEISLNIVVNHTAEGNIASKYVSTAAEYTLEPPSRIETFVESPTSVRISWSPPRTVDNKITYYIIKHTKVGVSPDSPVNTSPRNIIKSKKTELVLEDLEPKSGYSVQIEAFDSRNGRSGFSVPVLVMLPSEEATPVQNVRTEIVNSSAVRVWWTDASGKESPEKVYFVTYTPSATRTILQPLFVSNQYLVELQGLQAGASYEVQIYSKREPTSPVIVGSAKFTMSPRLELLSSTPKSNGSLDDGNATDSSRNVTVILGFPLTRDQMSGVFIGSGISAALVIMCVFTMYCVYKRSYEKRYRQVATGPRIVSSDEKHEMKVLSKNANGYPGQLNNGYANQTANVQSPLLLSNGHYPNAIRENGQICGVNVTRLVVNHSNGSLTNETVLTSLDRTNERDHEGGAGGDSGYCDPNQLPNASSTKEYSNDGTLRSRKCSDITVDDGFYESEVTGVNGGTSPAKLHTAV